MEIITPVCNLKELHVTNAVISAFVHSMVERRQIVASIGLFHCTQLLLGRHCGLFAPNGNKHDISLENHQQETEITAINCKHIPFVNILNYLLY